MKFYPLAAATAKARALFGAMVVVSPLVDSCVERLREQGWQFS